jgi:hypothetical protein
MSYAAKSREGDAMPAAKMDLKRAEAMLNAGATQMEVVAEHARRGVSITQSTVSTALHDGRIKVQSKYGLPRYAIPWKLKPEHRHLSPARMLRIQARHEQKLPLSETLERQRKRWIAGLLIENQVIHYDPDTAEGFWRVERRDGVDTWYVREPYLDDHGHQIPRPA